MNQEKEMYCCYGKFVSKQAQSREAVGGKDPFRGISQVDPSKWQAEEHNGGPPRGIKHSHLRVHHINKHDRQILSEHPTGNACKHFRLKQKVKLTSVNKTWTQWDTKRKMKIV